MAGRGVDVRRLIAARERAGYTQAGAAREIGWSRSRLGNYERNYSTPDVVSLCLLATAYGVGIDDLVGSKDGAE